MNRIFYNTLAIIFCANTIFTNQIVYCSDDINELKKATQDIVQSTIYEPVVIINIADNKYIVSIAEEKYSNDKKSILNASKKARFRAINNLSKFINDVVVSSNETLTIRKTNTYEYDVNNSRMIASKKDKELIAVIKRKAEGIVTNVKDIHKWKDIKSGYYIYAVGVRL